MIELLLSCGFDTLEYSWVKATIGICMLEDYSVAKKCQHAHCIYRHGAIKVTLLSLFMVKRSFYPYK
jgi:hypothetical protein